jgi:outer membrane protein assembly factor BamA
LFRTIFILAFLFLALPGMAQKAFLPLQYEISGELALKGTEVFKDSLSREQMVRELIRDLQNDGFLIAREISRQHRSDTLVVSLETGLKYFWLELKTGNVKDDLLIKSGYDDRIFRGKPLSYKKVLSIFDGLIGTLEDNGYPFASIKLDSLSQEGTSLSAALYYEPGPYISFDTLKLIGAGSKTDAVYLARLLQISPGTPFSQKKVNQSIARIQNLPYLKLEGEPELSFQNNEAILYIPVQDRKINILDGIIGFLPNEIEQNKLLVTGQFDLALFNIAGRGRNFGVSWQRLSQLSQNLRITAEEPLVLGSNIDVKASFFLLKEDSTFLNRDFRLDLGYRMAPSAYISFFSRRQSGDLLAVSQFSAAEVLPDIADFRYNNYGLHLDLNHLDDVFFPRRGWFGAMEFGIGNKRLIQNTGLPEVLYEDVNRNAVQYYINFRTEKHFYFTPKLGLMTAVNAGEMVSDNLLLNDMYRLGGLRSIRGFNENFIFANRYIYTNIEPRFYFDAYSYFMIFADMGNVTNKLSRGGNDWPFAFGSGFSMETTGGMFKFIYAVGQSQAQPLAFNYSRIHFGYTGRF